MLRRYGAVILGGLALAIALALVLTESKPRQSGSNRVGELTAVDEIRGDGRLCQSNLVVPAQTDGVRILVGTYGLPTPELGVSARAAGRTVTSGTLPAGAREGHVVVPLTPVEDSTGGARVCLRVTGGGRTVLYGEDTRMRFEWVRPGSQSWLDVLPDVARRFGWGKANIAGSWLLALAALVLGLAWLAAARVLARELRG
jgi:hypothetical protein